MNEILRIASLGSDEEFARVPELLQRVPPPTLAELAPTLAGCSTSARCAYFMRKYNIHVDVIIRGVTVAQCPVLRTNPFDTTLLNLLCVSYQFCARRKQMRERIRGLLKAGARVDLLSDLGETPLEAFLRSGGGSSKRTVRALRGP